jgi:hypothetical protein
MITANPKMTAITVLGQKNLHVSHLPDIAASKGSNVVFL